MLQAPGVERPQKNRSAVKRVLVVEDNPLNMKLFSAMLAAEGYGVLQAVDAPSGVEIARGSLPDLIVMDVNLPGMSGLDATQALKADSATQEIPIIVTTAYSKQYADEIKASGCDAFMAKPIGVSQFLEEIEKLLRRRVAAAAYVT